jgi:hypothetical protein
MSYQIPHSLEWTHLNDNIITHYTCNAPSDKLLLENWIIPIWLSL